MMYVVFYEIIGSRCNGTYLVNAKTSAQAKKLVLAVDEDYVCRGSCVEKFGTYEKLSALNEDQLGEQTDYAFTTDDLNQVKQEGSVYQLECGT